MRHRLLPKAALDDDDVRALEDVCRAKRQQAGISRPGADERNGADLLLGA